MSEMGGQKYKRSGKRIRYSMRFRKPKTRVDPRNPRRVRHLSKLVERDNRLDFNKILKQPLASEKFNEKIENENTLIYNVDIGANKSTIKRAFQLMQSDIKVESVKTLITSKGAKKAFIKLRREHNASNIANRLGII